MTGDGIIRLPGRTCRACGESNDGLTAASGNHHPTTGDMTICFTCGEVSVIEVSPLGQLTLREATTAELVTWNRLHGDLARSLQQFHAENPWTPPGR